MKIKLSMSIITDDGDIRGCSRVSIPSDGRVDTIQRYMATDLAFVLLGAEINPVSFLAETLSIIGDLQMDELDECREIMLAAAEKYEQAVTDKMEKNRKEEN